MEERESVCVSLRVGIGRGHVMCRVVLGRSWLGSAGLCASDWLRGVGGGGCVNYPACIFTGGACNRGIPDSGENAGKLESRICGEWGEARLDSGGVWVLY